jgi:hypothetical protein
MGPLTDDRDFEEIKYKFMAYEAHKISEDRGIQEAEPLYLEIIEGTRALAEQHQDEEAWLLVTYSYVYLYEGFKKARKNAKASGYIQKALEELDYAIEHLTNTVELRKKQCMLYDLLANDFKDRSDVESVSTAADLYILQINQYFSLYQETEDDAFVEMIKKACSKLQTFLAVQEFYVKFAQKSGNIPTETICAYVNMIIHVYSSVSSLPESQEKLAFYLTLLKDLGNQ